MKNFYSEENSFSKIEAILKYVHIKDHCQLFYRYKRKKAWYRKDFCTALSHFFLLFALL